MRPPWLKGAALAVGCRCARVKSPPSVAGFRSDWTLSQFEVSACLVEHVSGFSVARRANDEGDKHAEGEEEGERGRRRRRVDREEFGVRGGFGEKP